MNFQRLAIPLTALAAFAIAWFLKPDSQLPVSPPLPKKSAAARPVAPKPVSPPDVSSPETPAPAKIAVPYSPAPTEESVIRSRDETRLLRLTEALNLTQDQQDSLLKIIFAAQALENPENKPLSPAEQLALAINTAGNIEKSLDALLTPEQSAAFQAFRQRAQENHIETTAQTQLAPIARRLDLTPAQREKLLGLLRSSQEKTLSARPAALPLVLESSVLPIGPAAISADSVATLQNFADAANDPAQAQMLRSKSQLEQIETELQLYKPILTPAQFAQLKVIMDDRKKTLERVAELIEKN